MALGENIKQARTKAQISQDELAKRLGYKSRSTIAKIESGENDLTQKKVAAFAKALNKSLACASRIGRKPLNQYLSGIFNHIHNFIIR